VRHQLIEFGGGAGSASSPAACHRECECECDVPARCEAATEKGPTGAEARAPRHAGRLRLACRAPTHTRTLSLSLSLFLFLSLCAVTRLSLLSGRWWLACSGRLRCMPCLRRERSKRCDAMYRIQVPGWPTASFAWTSVVRTLSPHVCAVFTTSPNPRHPRHTLRAEKQKG
jgi:hypothetical protein